MTVRIDADLMIPGRGEPIEQATIIAEGAAIAYAGSRSGAPSTPDAVTIEVPVVMPGLWECHAHYVGIEQPDITDQILQPEARRQNCVFTRPTA